MPLDIEVQNGNPDNFLLAADDMFFYLNSLEKPTYKFEEVNTSEKVNQLIARLHESDDLRGIVVLLPKNPTLYGATGHVDLIYEDFMWDISLYSYGGRDLKSYIEGNFDSNFNVYIWILGKDK